MRRTVGGVRYDSESAILLGSEQDEKDPFSRQHLYKTAKGAFFRTWQNPRIDQYGLRPLSRQEALACAEELGLEKIIDEEFQDIVKTA